MPIIPKNRTFFERKIGNCPKCGHLMNSVGGLNQNVDPNDIPSDTLGAIHCGACLELLLFGPKTPLRMVTDVERQDLIQSFGGEERYQQFIKELKDRRAFKSGLL